jgi:hypothetical protein
LTGIIVIGFGGTVAGNDFFKQNESLKAVGSIIAYIMLILGGVAVLISFLGCCSAKRATRGCAISVSFYTLDIEKSSDFGFLGSYVTEY